MEMEMDTDLNDFDGKQNDENSNSSSDSSEKEKKLSMNKELQQLAFINPGRLTVTAGFNPEFSNREKRKLSRLMEQQGGKGGVGRGILRNKPRRQALHDELGCLVLDGRDVCDCQDPECQGCHYPCPQCGSEKCGTTCRCHRRWSYDHVDVYNEGSLVR